MAGSPLRAAKTAVLETWSFEDGLDETMEFCPAIAFPRCDAQSRKAVEVTAGRGPVAGQALPGSTIQVVMVTATSPLAAMFARLTRLTARLSNNGAGSIATPIAVSCART